ncbi:hypothetical protein [Paucisalibacillus globulus]|uniref:hypothetical protein n=1 Tax=Paucisalibacillus globulus TaxID=351095 RepID=UPI000BB9897A|nr:hypothetical protein [Paucisalibacillus globulus]
MGVFIILLLVIAGCSNANHNVDLGKSLQSIVEDKSNSEINLSSWTSFDWEKAFLFSPYTSQEEMEKQLGANFNDQSNLAWRDDIYLLVFKDKEKVIQYVEVEHQGVNLTIGENKYLTPSDDLIIMDK